MEGALGDLMASLFEWLKTIGSLAGMVVLLIAIWDWAVRNRPLIEIVPATLEHLARREGLQLRIVNVSKRAILAMDATCYPQFAQAVSSYTVEGVVEGMYPPIQRIVEAGKVGSIKLLPLNSALDGLEDADLVYVVMHWSGPNRMVRCRSCWQTTWGRRVRRWADPGRHWFPARVTYTVADVRMLLKAKIAEEG